MEKNELTSLDFIFEQGLHRIESQNQLLDALDLKVSILIGFLGALVVGLLVLLFTVSAPDGIHKLLSPLGKCVFAGSVGFTGAGILFCFLSFRSRDYYDGIKFPDLIEWTNSPVEETKEVFLPTLIKASKINNEQLGIKQSRTKYAILFTFFTLLSLLYLLVELGYKLLILSE